VEFVRENPGEPVPEETPLLQLTLILNATIELLTGPFCMSRHAYNYVKIGEGYSSSQWEGIKPT